MNMIFTVMAAMTFWYILWKLNDHGDCDAVSLVNGFDLIKKSDIYPDKIGTRLIEIGKKTSEMFYTSNRLYVHIGNK